jgi:predicted Rossmann-fold nucleotide-binding protein
VRRVVFTGGRDYKNETAVVEVLTQLASDSVIVTGGARGLDTIAHNYAVEMGFETEVYPADWDTHGKSAGHIRNHQMASLPSVEMVIAFDGGVGTAGMIKVSEKLEIPVVIVNEVDYDFA